MPTIAEAQAAAMRSGFLDTVGVDANSFENAPANTVEAMIGLYAKEVIEATQKNLDAEKKQSTGNLASSFTIRKVGEGKKFAIEVLAADYLKFVDLGVQGVDGAKNINTTSPFRFKYANPSRKHVKAIQKWILQNNVKARATDVSEYGKVGGERRIGEKTLAYIIAKSIKKKGLKKTGVWSKAWDATFKDFNEQVAKAVGNDIQITLQTMNKIINSGNNS